MSGEPAKPVVVCVDDEPAILSALRRLLRKEPYQVLTTEKPDEAVTWVIARNARVLIADQRMPSMSGLDVLELVRRCSPSTVRVMLSGQTDLTGVLTKTRMEAIECLVRKPWDDEELRTALRSLLARRERSTGEEPRVV